MTKRYLALDIGGTTTKFAILSDEGEVLLQGERNTEAEKGGPHIVENVKRLIREQDLALEGICISTAGIVDEEKGEIIHAGPQIPNYKGTSWKKIIEEGLKNIEKDALTEKGVIKSYEVDYDSVKHNPMGGIMFDIYINNDKELYIRKTLVRGIDGNLTSGGGGYSSKLDRLLERLNNE